MAKIVTDDKHYQNIADALRSYGNFDSEMNFYSKDMASGVVEVYKAGKRAEYDAFWDAYQGYGNRTNYYRAFLNGTSNEYGWNDVTFRPKYDLKPTSLAQACMTIRVTDLEALLSECGVTLDTENCANFTQCFQASTMTIFPTLHFKEVTNAENIFNSCRSLTTIRKIIFESGTNAAFITTFNNCTALKNVVAEGSIETNISFSYSPLTVESMKSIISCLKDYAGTENEYAYTITFKSSAFKSLEAEGTTSPNGNTWAEYIDDLKWNLTLA